MKRLGLLLGAVFCVAANAWFAYRMYGEYAARKEGLYIAGALLTGGGAIYWLFPTVALLRRNENKK